MQIFKKRVWKRDSYPRPIIAWNSSSPSSTTLLCISRFTWLEGKQSLFVDESQIIQHRIEVFLLYRSPDLMDDFTGFIHNLGGFFNCLNSLSYPNIRLFLIKLFDFQTFNFLIYGSSWNISSSLIKKCNESGSVPEILKSLEKEHFRIIRKFSSLRRFEMKIRDEDSRWGKVA